MPENSYVDKSDTIAVAGSSDRQHSNTAGITSLSRADTLITVRGRVVDEKGEPLNGVTVTVKETSKATSTDENGYFTISARKGDVLEFSYVGHENVESKIKAVDNSVFITLKPSVSKLEEVNVTVNTGYQEIPKERATGSFVKVDNELVNRSVSTDVLDRLKE